MNTMNKKELTKFFNDIKNGSYCTYERINRIVECLYTAAAVIKRSATNWSCYTRPSARCYYQEQHIELFPVYDEQEKNVCHCTYAVVTQPITIQELNRFAMCLEPGDWQPCEYMKRAWNEPVDLTWVEKMRNMVSMDRRMEIAVESTLLGMLREYSLGSVSRLENGNLILDCLMLLQFLRRGGVFQKTPVTKSIVMIGVYNCCSISKDYVAADELDELRRFLA
jgi:hypothetical protein